MTLAQLLRQRRHVMLDFDGPICAVFGGIPAHHVNRHYAAILRSHDIPVSDDLADGDDPLGIFQAAATERPDQAVFIEHTLRDLEVHAIATAPLMPGASETLLSLRDSGRTATIVSNNSTTAVRAFLTRHRLNDLVSRVVARTAADPVLLKPNPHLVRQAISDLHATPAGCVLVGDSTTDIIAGHAAGVAVIAYANKPGKRQAFAGHRPDVVIDTMHEIPHALSGEAQACAVQNLHT